MKNRLEKLRRKLEVAKARKDYVTAALLIKEIEEYNPVSVERERVNLYDLMKDNKDARENICYKLIEMTVAADLLYGKAMEFQEALPKGTTADYAERMKRLVKAAHDAVAFIDLYGNTAMSEHYATIVETVENKVMYFLSNVVANVVKQKIDFN